jgi:hypothetical protein
MIPTGYHGENQHRHLHSVRATLNMYTMKFIGGFYHYVRLHSLRGTSPAIARSCNTPCKVSPGICYELANGIT